MNELRSILSHTQTLLHGGAGWDRVYEYLTTVRVSSPLWAPRIQCSDAELAWRHPAQKAAYDAEWAYSWREESDCWTSDEQQEQLLDEYARSLRWAELALKRQYRRQAQRVVFMLRVVLKNEKDLQPAPLPTPDRAPAHKRLTPSVPTSSWTGAKKMAHAVDNLHKDGKKFKGYDHKRLVYVAPDGVMSAGDHTLLHVAGSCDKPEGWYSAKSGQPVSDFSARYYHEIFLPPRTSVTQFTVDGTELYQACVFANAIDPTWIECRMSDVEFCIRGESPEKGHAQTAIAITRDSTEYCVRLVPREAVCASSLMRGQVIVTVYTDAMSWACGPVNALFLFPHEGKK
jgi:hypothetical protein